MAERATFGKYVLLRKLATGGMGEIFLAKQIGPSGFEKLLVIKRILAHHHDKHDYLNMFLSEARLVAYLTHANIIQIHEMGQIDGDHFIAMEYVRGKSLRDLIDTLRNEGRFLPLPYVIDLAIKLCDGLGYAHQARDLRGSPMNIIHRDINPHNILISYAGDLKLIDFGIAKSEMTSVHTATGTIKGKFVYMSPEQSAADPIDRRSDIFSLGIVLYEMTVLENPFVRQNVVLSLEAIQRQPVAPPSAKRPDAAPLDAILERALQKRTEDRYQSCHEMRDDLRNLLRSGAVAPPEKDLQSYLSELFSAEIEEEDRLLAEADSATAAAAAPLDTIAEDALLPRDEEAPPAPAASVRSAPRAIEHAPFADEEPTLAGDLDGFAARSRAHSVMVRDGGPPPAGQVLMLIPPEEVAPGTGEEFGHEPVGPSTKSERVSAAVASAASGRPADTADIPVAQKEAPPPAETLESMRRPAAFDEPLSPSRPVPAPNRKEARSELASVGPPQANRKEARSELASVGPSQAKSEITREMRPKRAPSPVPADAPAAVAADTPPAASVSASDSGPRVYPPLNAKRDPTGTLPTYSGPWRRSMLALAIGVFFVTALAGYWATSALTRSGGSRTGIQPLKPIAETHADKKPEAVAPAPDPSLERLAPGIAPSPAVAPPEPRRELTAAKAPEPKREEPKPEPKPEPKREEPKPKKVVAAPPPPPPPAPAKKERPPKKAEVAAKEPESKREEPKPEPKKPVKPEPEVAQKPAPPPPPPKPEPKPEPEEAKVAAKKPAESPSASGVIGTLTLSTSEEVSVEHDGRGVGSSPSSVIVKKAQGTIRLSGGELTYDVVLGYQVAPEGLSVKVESNPWAIVKHDGISLGKTPQGPVPGARYHRFSLLRPGQRTPFVVSLVWNRKE